MKKSIDVLGQIQADALLEYTKLHNYHWNVKGIQFYQIHEMTEKIYNDFAALYDESAELILQAGEKPITAINKIVQKAQIQEDSGDDFEPKYVLENILNDYKIFMDSFAKLAQVAQDEDDSILVAFADEQRAEIQKNIWMLKATLS
jgi:starvation-inducible DNA-binding protein